MNIFDGFRNHFASIFKYSVTSNIYGTNIPYSLILVLSPILLHQRQQLIKLFDSVFFHLSGIQQFSVVLDEIQHQMLFNAVF